MEFILGIICGLVIAALVFAILAFFRAGLERKLVVTQKHLENAGPRPRGFIFEPPDEAEEFREELIKKNKEEGKDTHISELM